MSLLCNRRTGATADWMRGRVGKSPVRETRAVARRTGRLERTLAFDVHIPRGLMMQTADGLVPILFDERGYVQVLSSDDTVGLARSPWQRKHALDLTAGATCECCGEDLQFSFINLNPLCDCLELSYVGFSAETCTHTIGYNLDCGCINGHVGPG